MFTTSDIEYASQNKNLLDLVLLHKGDINIQDEKQKTALHKSYSTYTQIKNLLEAKANIHAKNELGNTPLHEYLNYVFHKDLVLIVFLIYL